MRLSPLSALCRRATFVLVTIIVVLPCSIATAAPILLNFDVSLAEPGFSAETDAGLAVTGGVEINNANSTNVGALFFDDEFVDLTSTDAATSLAYSIQGGLDAHPIAAGHSTSWQSGTTLLFSNFVLDQPGTLVSVGVAVNNVVGAAGGALVSGVDYVFTSSFLLLNIGSLGILEQAGQTPLGLMTFQLDFLADQPVDPVPDAASSLTLLGMAMAALAARGRFARRRR